MATNAFQESSERSILILNAGSSSLKFALFTAAARPRRRIVGAIERIGHADAMMTIAPDGSDGETNAVEAEDHARGLDAIVARLAPIASAALDGMAAVGHRIVHGGPRFDGARLLDQEVVAELERLSALDPDHLPAEISLVRAVAKLAPALRQVASFDTAFHRTLPRVARLIPIPRSYEDEGVRRYGFHGLSYTFLMNELERIAGAEVARGRVVLAHLGSGASLAAVLGGRCVDTTMGFTPSSGIMMGTRSGDLDPGVMLHLLRRERMTVEALDDLVNHRSGLLGVSGTSADMRDLLAREATDPRAADAVSLFCYQAKKAIGAFAAVLGGIDTLVFAGGIGERAAPIRARIIEGLGHLGLFVDREANDAGAAVISTDASPCTIRIMRTDEESVIAQQTWTVLDASTRSPRRTT